MGRGWKRGVPAGFLMRSEERTQRIPAGVPCSTQNSGGSGEALTAAAGGPCAATSARGPVSFAWRRVRWAQRDAPPTGPTNGTPAGWSSGGPENLLRQHASAPLRAGAAAARAPRHKGDPPASGSETVDTRPVARKRTPSAAESGHRAPFRVTTKRSRRHGPSGPISVTRCKSVSNSSIEVTWFVRRVRNTPCEMELIAPIVRKRLDLSVRFSPRHATTRHIRTCNHRACEAPVLGFETLSLVGVAPPRKTRLSTTEPTGVNVPRDHASPACRLPFPKTT